MSGWETKRRHANQLFVWSVWFVVNQFRRGDQREVLTTEHTEYTRATHATHADCTECAGAGGVPREGIAPTSWDPARGSSRCGKRPSRGRPGTPASRTPPWRNWVWAEQGGAPGWSNHRRSPVIGVLGASRATPRQAMSSSPRRLPTATRPLPILAPVMSNPATLVPTTANRITTLPSTIPKPPNDPARSTILRASSRQTTAALVAFRRGVPAR